MMFDNCVMLGGAGALARYSFRHMRRNVFMRLKLLSVKLIIPLPPPSLRLTLVTCSLR